MNFLSLKIQKKFDNGSMALRAEPATRQHGLESMQEGATGRVICPIGFSGEEGEPAPIQTKKGPVG
ncbi:hypothetical protein [Desulfoluna sp.]|uniref:hypothetical protein n=1 Tax=Desulfoluna sp. TaxID=2045199 RepID=UPI002634C603|nr:hypothetical protein [Desulfoluna sp.]